MNQSGYRIQIPEIYVDQIEQEDLKNEDGEDLYRNHDHRTGST